jgi:hypothetical protein
MQMYCTFVLFVNQHFPGLPTSETHCIYVHITFLMELTFLHISIFLNIAISYLYGIALINITFIMADFFFVRICSQLEHMDWN